MMVGSDSGVIVHALKRMKFVTEGGTRLEVLNKLRLVFEMPCGGGKQTAHTHE